jgi:hypothetical protein
MKSDMTIFATALRALAVVAATAALLAAAPSGALAHSAVLPGSADKPVLTRVAPGDANASTKGGTKAGTKTATKATKATKTGPGTATPGTNTHATATTAGTNTTGTVTGDQAEAAAVQQQNAVAGFEQAPAAQAQLGVQQAPVEQAAQMGVQQPGPATLGLQNLPSTSTAALPAGTVAILTLGGALYAIRRKTRK